VRIESGEERRERVNFGSTISFSAFGCYFVMGCERRIVRYGFKKTKNDVKERRDDPQN
jgi:hypothetical protein